MLTSNRLLTEIGILPVCEGPVRFAVGPPNGLTSNAWRIWATSKGDVYIKCRDNFKEAKVSLHTSGRWRMGFTTEAIGKNSTLLPNEENRAWEVWDKPPPSLPDTVVAFRLLFPTSELAVRPEQRKPSEWRNVIHIEAAPPGKLTVVTLFITVGDPVLRHESEPSFCLVSLDIGSNRRAKLIAHGDPEGDIKELIQQSAAYARDRVQAKGIQIPEEAYGYFFGNRPDGSRFIVGARVGSKSLQSNAPRR